MNYNKSYLTSFIQYCKNENALNKKRESEITAINLEMIRKEWEEKKKDSQALARYEKNLSLTEKLLENLSLVHYTNIYSLISILQNKAVCSVNIMDKSDISFNYRISNIGINEELHKYVFAYLYEGDWIYGPCKIIFKKEVVNLKKAYFIPKSWQKIKNQKLMENLFSIEDWKLYFTEHISLNYIDPNQYFDTTPVYNRPEFLFEDKIPIKYIEKIIIKDRDTFVEVCSKLIHEFGKAYPIIEMIECDEK